MSRTLSLAMLMAAFAQETSEAIFVFLTINHISWDEPIRAVMNGVNVTSRGNIFYAYPYDIIVPDQSADRPPQASLTIDNISREITAALERSTIPATVTMEIARSSSPDVIEVSWSSLTLKSVKYNSLTVSGVLGYEDISRETYPAGTFSPGYFPGMF